MRLARGSGVEGLGAMARGRASCHGMCCVPAGGAAGPAAAKLAVRGLSFINNPSGARDTLSERVRTARSAVAPRGGRAERPHIAGSAAAPCECGARSRLSAEAERTLLADARGGGTHRRARLSPCRGNAASPLSRPHRGPLRRPSGRPAACRGRGPGALDRRRPGCHPHAGRLPAWSGERAALLFGREPGARSVPVPLAGNVHGLGPPFSESRSPRPVLIRSSRSAPPERPDRPPGIADFIVGWIPGRELPRRQPGSAGCSARHRAARQGVTVIFLCKLIQSDRGDLSLVVNLATLLVVHMLALGQAKGKICTRGSDGPL